MSDRSNYMTRISRRRFIRSCATTALASVPVLDSWSATAGSLTSRKGPAQGSFLLDRNWLFGGKLKAEALEPDFDDTAFSRITLPHCVTPLSWQEWDPATWEDVWIYRRHFTIPPEFRGLRLFLHFDRVMAAATPVVNGHALPQHLGGFLPFEHEITSLVKEEDNVLSVAVDSRWLSVPPAGSPKGPSAVDYLLPGGISGSITLRALPSIFISEIFAKPVDVLNANRRLEVTCRVDAAVPLPAPVHIEANLLDRGRSVARVSKSATIEKSGGEISLTFDGLRHLKLWEIENPSLYDLSVTLYRDHRPLHQYKTRVGLREARFDVDGFFLNGRRTQIFGLNRHELYPYIGFAAPNRLLRRDAEILRHRFNCNMVRCSHYPQSEAFLDACDELGLMVWEEIPGWQYIGDERWQDLLLQDVEAMVRRDRNHPSIVIWGVRVNESHNDPALYIRTRDLAKSLDSSRSTSGTMTSRSVKGWHQDVYAFDNYNARPDHTVSIAPPLPDVPYLVSETVGQFDYSTGGGFSQIYRRAGDPVQQSNQALWHAQAHSRAADYVRCAGAIAWCAIDYASLMHGHQAVKCPGVADVFRIPKLGASFYLAQVDAAIRLVIEPDFYWDFGPQTPSGPGEHAAIFSNCERLELFIDGKSHAVLHADRAGYPNIKYPPFLRTLP